MRTRPTNGPIWATHKRKSRKQHSPNPESIDDTDRDDLTAIARDLYRAGKIPATMLDYVATTRTQGHQQESD